MPSSRYVARAAREELRRPLAIAVARRGGAACGRARAACAPATGARPSARSSSVARPEVPLRVLEAARARWPGCRACGSWSPAPARGRRPRSARRSAAGGRRGRPRARLVDDRAGLREQADADEPLLVDVPVRQLVARESRARAAPPPRRARGARRLREHGAVHERGREGVLVVGDLGQVVVEPARARGRAGTAAACAPRPRSRPGPRSPISLACWISSGACVKRPWASASVARAAASIHSCAGCRRSSATRVIAASSRARRSGSPSSQEAQNACSCPSNSRSRSPAVVASVTISPRVGQPLAGGVRRVQRGLGGGQRGRDRDRVADPARHLDRLLHQQLAARARRAVAQRRGQAREQPHAQRAVARARRRRVPSSSSGTRRSSVSPCVHRKRPP